MAGLVINELITWEGLIGNSKSACLIPLSIFWVIWKERNKRAFDGQEESSMNLKNRWFHYFDSIMLGHSTYSLKDFWAIADMLIDM